ncbi:hypothetical protein D3C76_1723960 [compost metagenome]
MLVHHLLASVAIDNDDVIVKRFDRPSDLKTIRQKDGDGNALLAQLIKKCILDINGLVHSRTPNRNQLVF